jgi:hypothetical protein
LQDEKRIGDKITQSLRQLERAELSLRNDLTRVELHAQLTDQMERLSSKLVLIAGQAALDDYKATRY